MLEKIAPILKNQCRLDRGRPIVAGVSGGPDSLCLLEVLRQAGYPLVAAHFDHQLRPESGAEAAAVEQTAARLGIPFVLGSEDVRAAAERDGQSIEEAARHLRYRFLFDQARQGAAQAVAVGHTADDQVETVLMHFLRGAGLAGLKGMLHRIVLPAFDPVIPVVRPLLDVWRAETVAYCAAYGLQPHYDPSNDSPDYLRNRLRNVLIPALESYNPNFRQAVWRTAQTLSDDHALLQEQLDESWSAAVVRAEPRLIVFDGRRLETVPLARRRGLVRRAVETLRPGLESTYAALERAAAFVDDPARPKQTDLVGGLRLQREGDLIYVSFSQADLPAGEWPQLPEAGAGLPMPVPGEVRLANRWRATAEVLTASAQVREKAELNGDRFGVWLDAGLLPGPLELRARRPGDRFEPLGMGGHSQKLSDLFVNEKLPERARARWPLLCSGADVIWVPGYRPAHRYRVTPDTQRVLHVVLTRPGGQPES